jgi:hypothetical protein
MVTKLEGNQLESVNAKLEKVTVSQVKNSIVPYACETKSYRLQPGKHGGSGVFFNPTGEHTRYGLTNSSKGSLYIAASPITSMKEVFQRFDVVNQIQSH